MTVVTLKEQAYKEIRQLILSGELKQGDVLGERALVEHLNMSRTPIRAALERLSAEGLTKYTPNKGLVVKELSLEDIIDFFDFRIAIESHVVRSLAEHSLETENIKLLEDNLEAQAEYVNSKDYVKFSSTDSAFHLKLAQIHGNAEIVSSMTRLQDRLHLVGLNVLRKEISRIQDSYKDHLHIFEYIIQGDGDKAYHKMIEHLNYGKKTLVL